MGGGTVSERPFKTAALGNMKN